MSEKLRKEVSRAIHGLTCVDPRLLDKKWLVAKIEMAASYLQQALDDHAKEPLPEHGLIAVEKEVPYLKGRELFAAHALQGLMVNAVNIRPVEVVSTAIALADEMVRQLEETKP